MRHFLLLYDVQRGELTAPPRQFRRADAAMGAYVAAERAHRNDAAVQVVLIGADSLDTVKVTHGNFFRATTLHELVGSFDRRS